MAANPKYLNVNLTILSPAQGILMELKRNVFCRNSSLLHQLLAHKPGKQIQPLKGKGWNITEGLNAVLFLN